MKEIMFTVAEKVENKATKSANKHHVDKIQFITYSDQSLVNKVATNDLNHRQLDQVAANVAESRIWVSGCQRVPNIQFKIFKSAKPNPNPNQIPILIVLKILKVHNE